MSIEVRCSCGGFYKVFPDGPVGENEAAYAALNHENIHMVMGQKTPKEITIISSKAPVIPPHAELPLVEDTAVNPVLIPLEKDSLFGNNAFVVVPTEPEQ